MSETPAYENFSRLVEKLGIEADSCPAALGLPPAMPDLPRGHTSWLVSLDRAGKRIAVPWYQHRPGGAYDPPSAPTVLLGLIRGVDSFHAAKGNRERWALAHGFDEDDRGAWKAYADLGRMAAELEVLLGASFAEVGQAARLARHEADQASEIGAVAAEPVRQYA